MASSVELRDVSKRYPGADRPALDAVSLAVEPGAFFSVLGPSGCGKTSLLRIIAGFEYPTSGRIFIDDRDVTGLPPRERDIAMVFQDYALYPHMTAEENITFNLRNKRVPAREIRERLEAVADTLGITPLLGKRPDKLSGGERQRVALGRAIIRRPRVFLMDEPLSNLDLKLREVMRIELGRIHKELGVTMLFVTHDQSEAMTLSSRMAILEKGRLQQCGTPDAIYRDPANMFVARFIGSPSMNMFRMRVTGTALIGTADPETRLPLGAGLGPLANEEIIVGVRPHHLRLARPGEPGIHAIVDLVEHLGRSNFLVCTPSSEGVLEGGRAIVFESDADVGIQPGESLTLTADPSFLVLFRARDGTALPMGEQAASAQRPAGRASAREALPERNRG
jgi:multiple sugar transport system ATP-binding protein